VTTTHPALPERLHSHYPVHAQKKPPVQKKPPFIAYIGGSHPHVTVTLDSDGHAYRLHTPRGWVTVRWREDYGTEYNTPVPMDDEISHPDTIITYVIVSPPSLPVYFRGAGDAKWVHLNGAPVPSVQAQSGSYHYTHPADPFRMDGGLNIVAVGYPDPE